MMDIVAFPVLINTITFFTASQEEILETYDCLTF